MAIVELEIWSRMAVQKWLLCQDAEAEPRLAAQFLIKPERSAGEPRKKSGRTGREISAPQTFWVARSASSSRHKSTITTNRIRFLPRLRSSWSSPALLPRNNTLSCLRVLRTRTRTVLGIPTVLDDYITLVDLAQKTPQLPAIGSGHFSGSVDLRSCATASSSGF